MRNIVILDSKAYMRSRIKELVSDYEVHVYEAVNSFQLFRILAEVNYDVSLIIMEINLDRESGIDILNKLKSRGIDIPVLIVTSENRKKKFVKSIKAGAVDYILKPFDEKMLLKRIVKGMDKKYKKTNKNGGNIIKEKNNKLNLDFQDYLSNQLKDAEKKQNNFSIMMITLFKFVDSFTEDVEKEYIILGNDIYIKLNDILKNADIFIRYEVQSFIATFKNKDEDNQNYLIDKIREIFKYIKENDERFKEYHLECAFVNYLEDGKSKEELLSKVKQKIVKKIDEVKRMEIK
ncbi:response regulator transcription factor [Clostridium sp.]|jgi:two-component system, OmpR family, response regulator PhoP|uniref:response regulator transcription factor n=1 Tax=Clostridium sp. TaxID=1506 RepID=UPI0039F61849